MRNTQEKHLPRKTYVLERNSDKEEGALFRCQKNAASFITHQSAIQLYPEEIIRAGDKKRDFILTPEILRTTMDGREVVNG